MKIYDRTNAISKAQIEIWEIREQMAEEVKDLSLDDKLKYILEKSKKAGDEYRKRIEGKKKHSEGKKN